MSGDILISQLATIDMISNLSNTLMVSLKGTINNNEVFLNDDEEAKTQKDGDIQLDIFNKTIKNLETKIQALAEECKGLDEKFIACVQSAEAKGDLQFIAKANNLKKKSEKKMIEIEKLEQQVDMLMDKKKTIFHQKYISSSVFSYGFYYLVSKRKWYFSISFKKVASGEYGMYSVCAV